MVKVIIQDDDKGTEEVIEDDWNRILKIFEEDKLKQKKE